MRLLRRYRKHRRLNRAHRVYTINQKRQITGLRRDVFRRTRKGRKRIFQFIPNADIVLGQVARKTQGRYRSTGHVMIHTFWQGRTKQSG